MLIAFSPLANEHAFRLSCEPLYAADEVEEMLASLDPDAWEEVVQVDGRGGVGRYITRQPLSEKIRKQFFPRLIELMLELNREYYRFNLSGMTDVDTPAIMRYDASTRGRHGAHTDAGSHFPTRKLSASVLLSDPADYEGGEVAFEAFESIRAPLGSALIFPSFAIHEVRPVTAGTRYAMVAWVHGPTFR